MKALSTNLFSFKATLFAAILLGFASHQAMAHHHATLPDAWKGSLSRSQPSQPQAPGH